MSTSWIHQLIEAIEHNQRGADGEYVLKRLCGDTQLRLAAQLLHKDIDYGLPRLRRRQLAKIQQ